MEGTSGGAVDLRNHLEIGRPEDGTETDTSGGSAQTQEGEEMVPSSTEGGQAIQDEESGGGD